MQQRISYHYLHTAVGGLPDSVHDLVEKNHVHHNNQREILYRVHNSSQNTTGSQLCSRQSGNNEHTHKKVSRVFRMNLGKSYRNVIYNSTFSVVFANYLTIVDFSESAISSEPYQSLSSRMMVLSHFQNRKQDTNQLVIVLCLISLDKFGFLLSLLNFSSFGTI